MHLFCQAERADLQFKVDLSKNDENVTIFVDISIVNLSAEKKPVQPDSNQLVQEEYVNKV
jgi:hypothetical protein